MDIAFAEEGSESDKTAVTSPFKDGFPTVSKFPGFSAFAYTSVEDTDTSRSEDNERSRFAVDKMENGVQSSSFAAETKLLSDEITRNESRVVRSYGTLAHLIRKVLNVILIQLGNAVKISTGTGDLVHVGASPGYMIAAIYICHSGTDTI